MKKIKEIIDLKVRKRANKGRGVISVPKRYIGKQVKVIIYNGQFSRLRVR